MKKCTLLKCNMLDLLILNIAIINIFIKTQQNKTFLSLFFSLSYCAISNHKMLLNITHNCNFSNHCQPCCYFFPMLDMLQNCLINFLKVNFLPTNKLKSYCQKLK